MISKTTRFEVLDALRGLCAILVVFFHLPVSSHFHALPLTRHGYLFVDFFFVLSGFVIAHAYRERIGSIGDAGRFLVRRVGRVWPLHLAILAAFVVLELCRLWFRFDAVPPFTGDRAPEYLITNVMLVQAFGIHDHLTWNGPAWSISVEMGCYVLFALMLLAAPRRFTPIAVVLAILGALAARAEQAVGDVEQRELVEQPRRPQFRQTGQVTGGGEGEVVQKRLRHHEGHGTARGQPATPEADPRQLEQLVQRAARQGDATDFLDLRAGDGLVIGDDRQRLHRGAGQAARFHHLVPEQAGEVRRGAEGPALARTAEFHTPAFVSAGETHDGFRRIAAFRHPLRQRAGGKRVGRGKEHGLHHPLLLLHRGRREQPGHARPSPSARIWMGAKVLPCRISSRPCRASSSVAAKVAAVAERRRPGSSSQPSGR